jgi:hypothetical protein
LLSDLGQSSDHFEIASSCDEVYVLYDYLSITFNILMMIYKCHMIIDSETHEICD